MFYHPRSQKDFANTRLSLPLASGRGKPNQGLWSCCLRKNDCGLGDQEATTQTPTVPHLLVTVQTPARVTGCFQLKEATAGSVQVQLKLPWRLNVSRAAGAVLACTQGRLCRPSCLCRYRYLTSFTAQQWCKPVDSSVRKAQTNLRPQHSRIIRHAAFKASWLKQVE